MLSCRTGPLRVERAFHAFFLCRGYDTAEVLALLGSSWWDTGYSVARGVRLGGVGSAGDQKDAGRGAESADAGGRREALGCEVSK